MSRNWRLTHYKEEQAVEMMVSKRDEQEPETYILQRGTGGRDDDQRRGQAGTRDLRPMKRNRWSRRRSTNGTSRNQRLTHYEEEQVVETTVSKRDKQGPGTYILQRGTGDRDDGQQTGQAGIRDLRPTKRSRWSRDSQKTGLAGTRDLRTTKRGRWSRWSANGRSRNQRLTSCKGEQVIEMTVSKRDKQEPATCIL